MSQPSHPICNSGLPAWLMKHFARAHIAVYRRTNGGRSAKLLWFPAALLTTIGRLYWRQLTRIYPPYKGYQDAADRAHPLGGVRTAVT
ncbi:hypothetical protein MHPYR_20311 [uncultured Mycobacterium sp.]|uniref:Uncharacterized protein n=1 Tax=uncultured Mycobacterium sp. TaxID=171292 RepID=A0A1Y5P8G6_9MYCO|nr:hypothetical protein MHPYR_20311 [uncultured Mycobacterium sp.]